MTLNEIVESNGHLLFFEDQEVILGHLKAIDYDSRLRDACINFEHNLRGALNVGHIPFFLARASTWRQRLNLIRASERILCLKEMEVGAKLTTELEAKAEKRAIMRMTSEWEDPNFKKISSDQLVKELLDATTFPEYNEASSELLRQLCVMAWNSFEILATDVIKCVLNESPHLVLLLADAREFKSQLSGGAFLLALSREAFNLSSGVGSFVTSEINFDSLHKLRVALGIILKDCNVDTMLKSQELYEINSKRNLIVHRRGMIDSKYIANSSCVQNVGDRLRVEAQSVKNDFRLIVSYGAQILTSATHLIKEP